MAVIEVPDFKTAQDFSLWVESLDDKFIQSWKTKDWLAMYEKLTAFVVSNDTLEGLKLTEELRKQNITAEFDLTNKKFVKQLEKASKLAKYAVILGEDEIAAGNVTVKDLDTSEQKTIKRQDLVF